MNSTINRPLGYFEYLYLNNGYKIRLQEFFEIDKEIEDFFEIDKINRFIKSEDTDENGKDYDVYRYFEKEFEALLFVEFNKSKNLFEEKFATSSTTEQIVNFLNLQFSILTKIENKINTNPDYKDYDFHNRVVIGLKNIIIENRNILNLTPTLPKGKKTSSKTMKSFKYLKYNKEPSNLTVLLNELKFLELVNEDTKAKDFKKVFSGKDIINKIIWTGNISQLYHFIIYLHNKAKKVEYTKQKIWFITINCFVMYDGTILENSKLKSQHSPTDTKDIENAINIL